MHLNLKSTLNSIVDNMLDRKIESSDRKGIIISTTISHIVNFGKDDSNELTDKEVSDLTAKYPTLIITKYAIKAELKYNMLYVYRRGAYHCYSNIGLDKPTLDKNTPWQYTTNHEVYWKEMAYNFIQNDYNVTMNKIRDALKEVKHDICLPECVVPNFASITNIRKFNVHTLDRGNYGDIYEVSVSKDIEPMIHPYAEQLVYDVLKISK